MVCAVLALVYESDETDLISLKTCLRVCTVYPLWTCEADMENVRNFTRAGLFISRFYPKVHELRQF